MVTERFLIVVALVASLLVTQAAHAQAGSPAVVITEIFYNPDGSDEGAEFIEFENLSADPVDMAGWEIDGAGGAIVGDAVLAANGRVVITKDLATFEQTVGFGADAAFVGSLSNGGEQITVRTAAGVVVDTVLYDDAAPWPTEPDGDGASLQLLDVGLDNGLAGSWGWGAPTPGALNQAVLAAPGVPVASQGRGLYDGPVAVELTADPGATIYYTLNGSAPSASSASSVLYSGPVTVSAGAYSTATLRAVAVNSGGSSLEMVETYIFPAGLIDPGFSTLGTISLQFDNGIRPTDTSCNGFQSQCDRSRASIDFFEPDGTGFGVTGGAGLFGGTSIFMPKNSFRLHFDDEWGVSDLEFPVFQNHARGSIDPVTEFDKLELRTQSWDGPYDTVMHNHVNPDYYVSDRWWKDTVLDLGGLSPHGRFVNVFVNGRYHGVYDLRERFDAQWFESYGTEVDDDDVDSVKWDGRFVGDVHSIDSGTRDLWDHLNGAATWAEARDYIDARRLIFHELTDSLTPNSSEQEYRLAGASDPASPDDAILMHSDNDATFGGAVIGEWWRWGPGGPSTHHLGWLWRWKDDPEFRQMIYDETAKAFCGDGALTLDASLARLDRLVGQISVAMDAEEERWVPTSFDSAIVTARAALTSGIPDLHQGWADEGLFLGCELSPQMTGPPNALVITGRDTDIAVPIEDPDGDPFTVVASGLPAGLITTSDHRLIGQTNAAPGDYPIQLVATDDQGRTSYSTWTLTVINGGPTNAAIVLNEFNAVDPTTGWGGTDAAYPGDATNGGDWFELAVIQDHLDLRGWSIELWDRDRPTRQLKLTDTFTIAPNNTMADTRQGAIIAISETGPENLSYTPLDGDNTIHLTASGTALTGGGDRFDTNHQSFQIIIRNQNGELVGSPMGETEQWQNTTTTDLDAQSVFVHCPTPRPDTGPADYQTQSDLSTFGTANQCNANQQLLAIPLATGDVNCDTKLDVVDSLIIAQTIVGNREPTDQCPLPNPATQTRAGAGDVDCDETTTIIDALLIAQYQTGNREPTNTCPLPNPLTQIYTS